MHNYQLQRLKRLAHRRQLGVGLQRVFPHDVRRTDFALCRAVRQLADAIAGMRRQALNPPGFRELLAVFGHFYELIARIGVR